MSEVKRYVLRGPADCPAPDGSQIERLLPGWQVVDAAAYDALQARVKQVVEEGRAISRLNVQQAVEIGGLQARVRELQELVGDLQEENTRLDRELEYAQQVTIPYLEQERNELQESEPCVWTENDSGENGMNFCPYCGRQLKEQVYGLD